MRLASFTPPEESAMPSSRNRRRERSLARISLRARHPLLPDAELGTSTSLTAAATSASSPLGRSAEGFFYRGQAAKLRPQPTTTKLGSRRKSATDRKITTYEKRETRFLPEGNDLSTLLTISFPRHYCSKFRCNRNLLLLNCLRNMCCNPPGTNPFSKWPGGRGR